MYFPQSDIEVSVVCLRDSQTRLLYDKTKMCYKTKVSRGEPLRI